MHGKISSNFSLSNSRAASFSGQGLIDDIPELRSLISEVNAVYTEHAASASAAQPNRAAGSSQVRGR
jgi:hypothetical protein